jgi:outer membrane protein, adhesin transport system
VIGASSWHLGGLRAARGALVLAGLLHAAAWSTPVTWADVVRSAQSSHPQVLGKLAGQSAARAEWEAASWQRYPTPSIEAGTLGGSGSQTLRLDQPVWTAGRIDATIVASEWRAAAARAAADEARREVTLKALTAVAEAFRHMARERVAELGQREHERLLALIQRRVAQEVSPAADEVLARARWATAQSDVLSARQGVRQALLQVSQLMGQPVSELDETDYGQTVSMLADPKPAAMSDTQLADTSPLLRRLLAEVDVSVAEAEEKRAQQWPQLVLRVERLRGTVSDTRAGLIFSFQPGAGLAAQSGLAAAVAKRDVAREAVGAARRDIRQQFDQLWDEWDSAKARLQMAARSRADTEDILASYIRQYAVGRKSWLDVLNALRESVQAELAWVDLQHQVWTSAMRWHALMGDWDQLYASPEQVRPTSPIDRPVPVQEIRP